MAISTKSSKCWYILRHFAKVQTISDFEKNALWVNLSFYRNHSSILEIVIFNISVQTAAKFWEEQSEN